MSFSATAADAYKVSHKGFLEPGTNKVYSNFTARNFKHMPIPLHMKDNKIVWFGIQAYVTEKLVNKWNNTFFKKPKDAVCRRLARRFNTFFGMNKVDVKHFEDLHDLGYLPIHVKSLPEGSVVPAKVALMTITNTNDRFAWLTNYLETQISADLWKPATVATIARAYRKLCDKYAMETVGNTTGVEFQCHDFSMRGMSGEEDAERCSPGHLLYFKGTDTLPAVDRIEDYYGVEAETFFIGTSVPASEHSLASLGYAVRGELEAFRKWMTVDYPTGIVSLVSDTTDYWKVITDYAAELKDDIMARKPDELGLCKVVFRPDSGNPADIICGLDYIEVTDEKTLDWHYHNTTQNDTIAKIGDEFFEVMWDIQWADGYSEYNGYTLGEKVDPRVVKGSIELLWETFGGTITEKGYKMLDSNVGLIYGDSITLAVAEDIFKRLKKKGFASLNVVLGIGSYTYNYLTRDSAGMAIKATYAEVEGKPVVLSKDPVTDDGTKKSAKGLIRIERKGDTFVQFDEQTPEQEAQGALETILLNGVQSNLKTWGEVIETANTQ